MGESTSILNTIETLKPSRSAMKREQDRLQALGVKLVALTPGKLAKIEIPEALRHAVNEARRLTSMEAKRRQLQYIGRIMEQFDTTVISRNLSNLDQVAKKNALIQKTEKPNHELAKKILVGSDDVLYQLVQARLDAQQIQQLRQLVRSAKKKFALGLDIEAVSEQLATSFSELPFVLRDDA
jgi:ribosome-associated protein